MRTKEETRKMLNDFVREERKPTLWYNQKQKVIELHFKNEVRVANVIEVSKKIRRADSDKLALENGFKRIIYSSQDNEYHL